MAGPSVTSVILSVPAGTAEGDLMVAAITISYTSGIVDPAIPFIVAPDGWTEVLADYPGGTLAFSATDQVRFGVYTRVASSAELASYTWDWSAGGAAPVAAAIQSFPPSVAGLVPSIAVAATAINVIPAGGANPTTCVAPSITPFQTDTILVTFYAARNGENGAGTAFTVPAGMSDFGAPINLQTYGTADPLGMAWFLEPRPAAGATGTRSSTCDVAAGAAFQGLGYAIAIQGCGGAIPEPVPPPPQELAAVRFDGDASGAYLTPIQIGDLWIDDFTIEMCAYLETTDVYYAAMIENGSSVNGRTVYLQHENSPPYILAVTDSQTGTAGGLAPDWAVSPPPLNTWLYFTFRCPPGAAGETLVATWTTVEGAPAAVYEAQRLSGIDAPVVSDRISLNGGGSASNGFGVGFTWRAQYVRGRTGDVGAVQAAADRQSIDPTGWDFWWAFEDDGGGGVTVVDKTGNGNVPTLVNATLTTGPSIPVVP